MLALPPLPLVPAKTPPPPPPSLLLHAPKTDAPAAALCPLLPEAGAQIEHSVFEGDSEPSGSEAIIGSTPITLGEAEPPKRRGLRANRVGLEPRDCDCRRGFAVVSAVDATAAAASAAAAAATECWRRSSSLSRTLSLRRCWTVTGAGLLGYGRCWASTEEPCLAPLLSRRAAASACFLRSTTSLHDFLCCIPWLCAWPSDLVGVCTFVAFLGGCACSLSLRSYLRDGGPPGCVVMPGGASALSLPRFSWRLRLQWMRASLTL